MPMLKIPSVPPDVMARLKAHRDAARARGDVVASSLAAVALRMLIAGLDAVEQRAAGARAVNASRTPEERSAAARQAVRARWAKRG